MIAELTLLDKQCFRCKKDIASKSIACHGCKVVEYCSEGHRIAGQSAHQAECNIIQKLRASLEDEAQVLREDLDGNLFDSSSVFWSISETRPWSDACVALIQALSHIRTVKACRVALDHGFEWLELNWGVDHQNVRFRIAALEIRLGKDQDAYDVMKWYATTGKDPTYSWVELYDLQGEDALESLQAGNWTDEETHLSTMASITLVKLRIWLNLRSLYNVSIVASRLPREIMDYIRESYVATGIVADNQRIKQDLRNGADIQSLYMRPLELQLNDMFNAVERSNTRFWRAIVEGRSFVDESEDPDSRECELCVAVSSVREAWEETPGAIEWISNQLEIRGSVESNTS